MIIRRRYTQNYTVLSNEVFDDERLLADEVGILAYLRSRPADWEIRRPALMRRWRIGREGIKRIITNWVRTGWCVVEWTRLSDGRFNVIYEIRDEPGPSLSEEEVRRALSLGSSEAAETDSEDSNAPDASHDAEPCGDPDTGYPSPVDRIAASRMGPSKEGLPNTILPNTESTQALWTSFAKTWPSAHVVSPLVCENLFASLTIENKEKAVRGVGPYLSDCKSKTRKICDLATYLREQRWNSSAVTSPSKLFICKANAPQAWRWIEYWKAIGRPYAFVEKMLRDGKAVTFEAEWPPALPAAKSPGPPLDATQASLDALHDFGNEMTG